GPAQIGLALAGTDRMLAVATALGTPDERIECLAPARAGARAWRDPNVVLCLDPAVLEPAIVGSAVVGSAWVEPAAGGSSAARPDDPGPSPTAAGSDARRPAWSSRPAWMAGAGSRFSPDHWALPEDAFEHRDSMVTKAEVRALVLARLGPRPGRLIWDVGAGSGSVAVECARFGAAVVAADRDADAVARVIGNARTHGVTLVAVRGSAPAVLSDLPDPDGVFVGGGGPEVVAGCLQRRPAVIVVALAALDRVRPAWDLLAESGYEVGGAQVAASRLSALPDGGLRLAATNPVVLVWGRRPERTSGRETR
ncbi:MAG: hypothetical protein ACQSGP_14560, partial [Frankia sp.]